MRLRRAGPALLAAVLVLGAAAHAPAGAGPMLGGGDTRDFGAAPAFSNFSKIVVHPGQGATLQFDVQNRYNASVLITVVTVAFHVGGDWLNATSIANVPNPPAFDDFTLIPFDLGPGGVFRVERNFTTSPATPAGVYLVSLELQFRYRNDTNVDTLAHIRSFGSIAPTERGRIDLHNPNATLAALGVDGIAPDTSITVDDGRVGTLYAYAVGFGIAVIVLGSAAGYGLSRRAKSKRRKRT